MYTQPRAVRLFLATLILLLPAAASFLVAGFLKTTTTAAKVKGVDFLLLQKQDQPSSFDDDTPASFNIDEVRRRLEALAGRTEEEEEPAAEPPAATPEPPSPSVVELKKPVTMWFHSSFPTPPAPEPASSAVEKTTADDIDLTTPPPITTMDRKRRLAEVELLRDLLDGNEAVPILQDFWVHERGAAAAARLLQADALAARPTTWPEAEAVLLQLVATHGVHWAEPVNRLATLYFIQGRLDESEKLCHTVLRVKPWHFGALSGLVLVYGQMQNFERARHWAELRLPPLSPKSGPQPLRHEWVKRSVKQARDALSQAEQRLQDQFFGPRDKKRHKRQTPPPSNLTQVNDSDGVDDCWQ
jgi:hypothetical protein